jgi:hypothetical protein
MLAMFAVLLALGVLAFWVDFRYRAAQGDRPEVAPVQTPVLAEPAFQRASSLLGFDTGSLRGMTATDARQRLRGAVASGQAECRGLEGEGAGTISCTLRPVAQGDTETMMMDLTLDADSVTAVRLATPGSISRWQER